MMKRINVFLLIIVLFFNQIYFVTYNSSESFAEDKLTVDEIGRVSGGNFNTRNIAIFGSYGYLADDSVLRILNLSNLSNPYEYTFLNISVIDLKTDGLYLYVVERFKFSIYSISNPISPIYLSSISVNGSVLEIDGSKAYVGGYTSFQIIDISDPNTPRLLGSYFTGSSAYSVSHIAVLHPYAYLGTMHGVLILNIIDSSNPILVKAFGTCQMLCGVSINNTYLFVSNFSIGMDIYSLKDPTSPVFISHFASSLYNLAVKGHYAYLTKFGSGIQIVDLSDIYNPYSNSTMTLFLGGLYASKIVLNESIGFITDSSHGLTIVNLSDILSPKMLSNIDYPTDDIYSVYIQGDFLFQACINEGLNIYSIKDINNPKLLGNLFIYAVDKVVVSDSVAYLVWPNTATLYVVNVSDFSNPKILSSLLVGHPLTRDLYLNNQKIFMVGDYGVDIIDVSNLTNPTRIGWYQSPDKSYDISVSGELAFVADGKNGLSIFNISDLNYYFFATESIGNFKTSTSDVRGVVYNGQYVFITDYSNGLQVININNISKPSLERSLKDKNGFFFYPTIMDNKIFTADNKILTIFDISNALNPVSYRYNTNYNTFNLFVTSDKIFLASGGSGTPIFNWRYEKIDSSPLSTTSPITNSNEKSSKPLIPISPFDFESFLVALVIVTIGSYFIRRKNRNN